jgi:hypothetical protein
MNSLPNFAKLACSAPLPFANLLKGPKITFGGVAKGNWFTGIR